MEKASTGTVKRLQLTVKIDPPVMEQLRRVAAEEGRTLGGLGAFLLEWAAAHLRHVGNTLELKQSMSLPRAARVSREAQEELHTALRVILERAPSAVIAEVSDKLTEWAGKYGDERRAKR